MFPTPETNEIVIVVLEKSEVGIKIHLLRVITAICSWTHSVMKIVPDVRTSEVDRLLLGVRRHSKIARVNLRNNKRPGGI